MLVGWIDDDEARFTRWRAASKEEEPRIRTEFHMTSGIHSTRRMVIFISHANPEDNDVARWLTLQLAQYGYTVWCDVARLIGGEDFWRDIETVIRDHTVKFLFVLSRASNAKQGTLDELNVARITAGREQLRDFIVPLRVDDLPFGDINISIARLNVIRFDESWAEGFGKLLEKLENDKAPRASDWSPATVAGWWRENYSAEEGIREEPEDYLSNWFILEPPPNTLFFHEITRSGPGPTLPEVQFNYPVEAHSSYLVSFAEQDVLDLELPQHHRIARTLSFSLSDFISNEKRFANMERNDRRNMVVRLLRQSWDLFVKKKTVGSYELANKQACIYLRQVDGNDVRVAFSRGERTVFRALTGYKTVSGPEPDSKRKRFWHFAISTRPLLHPIIGYAVYAHVIFSDDGQVPWDDKDKMHRARRQQCKEWWSPIWRDRIIAFFAWLADGSALINLPAGRDCLKLRVEPITFESPVAYSPSVHAIESDDQVGGTFDEAIVEDSDEDDFDEEEFEGELDV